VLAEAFLLKKNFPKAEESIKRTLQLDPNNDIAHTLRGKILLKMNRIDEAEGAYQTALSLNPFNADTHAEYAHLLLFQKRQIDQAYDLLLEGLKLAPESFHLHILMGYAKWEKGEKEEAEACFQTALRLNPDHYRTHYNYGYFLLIMKNKPKEAYTYLREAIRMNPEDEQLRKLFLTSLKAKNKFYGLFWNYALMLHRIGKKRRRALIIGIVTAYIISHHPFLFLLMLCYIGFNLFGLGINFLFNTLIRRGWMKF
jgi:Tfp pilus assembly protein PilF